MSRIKNLFPIIFAIVVFGTITGYVLYVHFPEYLTPEPGVPLIADDASILGHPWGERLSESCFANRLRTRHYYKNDLFGQPVAVTHSPVVKDFLGFRAEISFAYEWYYGVGDYVLTRATIDMLKIENREIVLDEITKVLGPECREEQYMHSTWNATFNEKFWCSEKDPEVCFWEIGREGYDAQHDHLVWGVGSYGSSVLFETYFDWDYQLAEENPAG